MSITIPIEWWTFVVLGVVALVIALLFGEVSDEWHMNLVPSGRAIFLLLAAVVFLGIGVGGSIL